MMTKWLIVCALMLNITGEVRAAWCFTAGGEKVCAESLAGCEGIIDYSFSRVGHREPGVCFWDPRVQHVWITSTPTTRSSSTTLQKCESNRRAYGRENQRSRRTQNFDRHAYILPCSVVHTRYIESHVWDRITANLNAWEHRIPRRMFIQEQARQRREQERQAQERERREAEERAEELQAQELREQVQERERVWQAYRAHVTTVGGYKRGQTWYVTQVSAVHGQNVCVHIQRSWGLQRHNLVAMGGTWYVLPAHVGTLCELQKQNEVLSAFLFVVLFSLVLFAIPFLWVYRTKLWRRFDHLMNKRI